MAKAWRNEAAAKINARREAGSKEPSARVQMHLRNRDTTKGAGNWLLAGLLIRAGIQGDMPFTLKPHLYEPYVPATEGFAKRLSKAMREAFSFLGA